MPFGLFDTTQIDYPANIDQAYINGLRTRAGLEFPAVLREIDQRITALNTTLDPLVAGLISTTTDAVVEGTGGGAFTVERKAEYALPRPQINTQADWMLPIYDYDVSTSFTEDGLEGMSMTRLLSQIDGILGGYRAAHRREAFKRLFDASEQRIAVNSASVSPGFAGSGTGLNVWTTPYPDGSALPGGYTHYFAADTDNAGELKTVLKAAVARLRMWRKGPFDLVANSAMIALITAMTGSDASDSFVSAGTLLVRAGTSTQEALVDAKIYLGVLFGDVRVHMAITDTTSPNIAIYASAGPLNEENPLVWRYDESQGRGAILRYRDFYPLSQAIVKQRFGIGVKKRTAAVLIYAASGATVYVTPTDL